MDRDGSAERIERDIETLAGPDYTLSDEAIRRYAYTRRLPQHARLLRRASCEALGFDVEEDPVGTLVARNRPKGEPVFGVGSHCDSNRNGGKYDGTMGVVTALEVCRLNAERGLDLPLQLISFLEEEGSGFGQMLLGSRIIAQRVTEEDLRERFRAIDDGRSFWEHAADAGYAPERWRECAHVLDDLTGWIEMHIEQARVLQDTGNRIGIVTAIAGYVHADVTRPRPRRPRRRDADGLPPRPDAAARGDDRSSSSGSRARPARARSEPSARSRSTRALINAIAASVRFSLDIRGPVEDAYRGVARDIAAFAEQAAAARGMTAEYRERQTIPPTPMDERIVDALETAAQATGEPYMRMHSGAAHDTMCVADRVPTRDGLRPVQGRDQPPPGRGREPGRRGARGRDHPGRDSRADLGSDPEGV